MSQLAYRAETLTPEEIAAQDPFCGNGVRLEHDSQDLAAVAELVLGMLVTPCVVFPGCAWADLSDQEFDASEARKQWHEILEGQHDGIVPAPADLRAAGRTGSHAAGASARRRSARPGYLLVRCQAAEGARPEAAGARPGARGG